ncbi:uncharacterized protein LOC110861843 isoform X1 [Folsomia candida]|uniref:uncharacterized protein LOC110861844 isoform X1 n=1 Tax=Folsomia candida TaxID=158441 RepID=UPI001605088B|nr:uncharacterized protein LOC110861844 isoform X1 [Folsomia candida]XP_035700902.1 uncharacterized protein LOC110861843 isoform X1 [Folsomia candida]
MAHFDGQLLMRTIKGVPCCTWCRFGELPSFIRQIGGKSWKPFAILPNIEGQKFTIGETFTSREEDGEFLLWKRPMKGKLKITTGGNLPVCEIICAENKYWVSPLLSGREVVSVNDIEIKGRTELKFGDYLSLGVEATRAEVENWKRRFRFPDNDDEMPGWAKLELDAFQSTHRLVLLFQRREYDFDPFWRRVLEHRRQKEKMSEKGTDADMTLERVEEKKEAGFVPYLDDLVVSRILSYLPFNDVKNVRFLSKVWNQEALRLIEKKGIVNFDFSLGHKKLDDSTKLFRYNYEMQDNPIPHWRIIIPCIGSNEEIRPAQGEKVIADFHKFLGLKKHNVTSLDFSGTIASKSDYDEQIRILEMCPTQTIQSFELGWTWVQNEASGRVDTFPKSIQFTNLKTFVLSMDVGHSSGRSSGLFFPDPMVEPIPFCCQGCTRARS